MMDNLNFSKDEAVKIKILSLTQPIGEFYIGVAKACDVVSICSAQKRERDELEKYIGMQRPLNPERVKEIKKYIETRDASFPNSIILAINESYYFIEDDYIFIKRDKKSANIIDGQHRLAGFDQTSGKDFDIILTLFPELEFEEQAYLFSVINTKMTRINQSLAADLLTFSKINTPEKLVHEIAVYFNKDPENPWFKKIKMLGRKESGDIDPILSQNTFTKRILDLIFDWTCDSYEVRDILKRNHNDRYSLNNFYDENKTKRFILWKPFINGEDKFIYTILKDYFISIQNTFPDEWEDSTKILTKTTGYSALMNVFDKLVRRGFDEKQLTIKYFTNYLKKAKDSNKIKELISDNYPPGGIGERELTKDFVVGMNLPY